MTYRPPAHRLVQLRSAARLDARMRECDVNASELGAAVGVTRQTIGNLRRGLTTSTSIDTAKAIAAELDLSPGRLFVMPSKRVLDRIEANRTREVAS